MSDTRARLTAWLCTAICGCSCAIETSQSDVASYMQTEEMTVYSLCEELSQLQGVHVKFERMGDRESALEERVRIHGAKSTYTTDELTAMLFARRWTVGLKDGNELAVTRGPHHIDHRDIESSRVLLKSQVNLDRRTRNRLAAWAFHDIRGSSIAIACESDNVRLVDILTTMWAGTESAFPVVVVLNVEAGVDTSPVEDVAVKSVMMGQLCGKAKIYWLPELLSYVIAAKSEDAYDGAVRQLSKWRR